jgi:cytosine/adenosine deaminase-related metal-dependent hydrolase
MSSAMLRALRAAHLAHRAACSADEVLPDLLANNTMVARRFFDEPLLGELSPGAPADIAVMDSLAPTPIASNNLAGHLIYGASEAPVRHTIARGRILLEDFVHATLDPRELAARARELSPALWERFHALKWGTSFLG